jgi:GNAT superfamily N-acetyltransferase
VGGAAAASSGCAAVTLGALGGSGADTSSLLDEVRSFVSRCDRVMGALGGAPLLSGFVPELAPTPEVERAESLLRKSIRSLFIAGSFRDLSEDARTHPAVQERLWAALPEMDEAVSGMTGWLEGLSSTERADFSRALRADPGLPMRVAGAIDEEARAMGVPLERRAHLRAMAVHIAGRMKQSSGMLFDEYTAKVKKLGAQSGDLAEVERRLAVALGDAAYQQLRERTAASVARWAAFADTSGGGAVGSSTVAPELAPPPPPPASRAPLPPSEPGSTPGAPRVDSAPPVDDPSVEGTPAYYAARRKNVMIVGGVLMGLAAVTAGISGVVLATSSDGIAGLIGLTVGAVLLLAGIITLIVGALMRES